MVRRRLAPRLVQALAAAITTLVLAATEQLPGTTVPVVEPDATGVDDITWLTPDERAPANDIRAIRGRTPLPPS